MGMSGTITILAKGAKLPSAGEGPNSGLISLMLAGIGVAMLGLGGVILRLVRARNR